MSDNVWVHSKQVVVYACTTGAGGKEGGVTEVAELGFMCEFMLSFSFKLNLISSLPLHSYIPVHSCLCQSLIY